MRIKYLHILTIVTLLFSSAQVMAKTDLPADGNGTDGVTITGVNDTTDYQYHSTPDYLRVTAINGVPVNNTSVPPPPAPGSKGPTPEEYGENYDKKMRKWLNIPAEWLTCKTSGDCVTSHIPCDTGLAVNKQYRNEVENLICHGKCLDVCEKSTPDTSQAVCKKGQCVTIIYPYKP